MLLRSAILELTLNSHEQTVHSLSEAGEIIKDDHAESVCPRYLQDILFGNGRRGTPALSAKRCV